MTVWCPALRQAQERTVLQKEFRQRSWENPLTAWAAWPCDLVPCLREKITHSQMSPCDLLWPMKWAKVTHIIFIWKFKAPSLGQPSLPLSFLSGAPQCPQRGLYLPFRSKSEGGRNSLELTPDGQCISPEMWDSFASTESPSPSRPTQCVVTAGAWYNCGISASGLKSERSFPGYTPSLFGTHQGLRHPCRQVLFLF